MLCYHEKKLPGYRYFLILKKELQFHFPDFSDLAYLCIYVKEMLLGLI